MTVHDTRRTTDRRVRQPRRIGRIRVCHLVSQFTAAALLFSSALHAATFRWASSSNRIHVESGGAATLSDIKAALPLAPLNLVDPVNKVWLLRAHLLIQQGSVLALHGASAGGDVNELRLQSNNSAQAGSFVSITADWGSIDIKGTKITSWDSALGGPDLEYQTFGRAFIRVRSSLGEDGASPRESRLDIVQSDIGYLGYDASEAYGLVWKVAGVHPDPAQSIFDYVNVYGDVILSRIHHNFQGLYSWGAHGGQWLTNEVDQNIRCGFDLHDDSDDLRIEGNQVHHNGDHGILASRRCDHLTIRGNRSWANAGNGVQLRNGSNDSVIGDNRIELNADNGIALFNTARTQVQNNFILSNSNAGIRFSAGSSDNRVENNEIGHSGKYGLYFYSEIVSAAPDPEDSPATQRTRRNTIASNYVHHCQAEGIRLTDGDEEGFIGNVFSDNGPTLRFTTSRLVRLIGNLIPSSVSVRLAGSASVPTSVWFKEQPLIPLMLDDSFSAAHFEDDAGAIFDLDEKNVPTGVDNAGSFLTLTTAQIGSASTVVRRNFFVSLDGGVALVTPTLWDPSDPLRKQWTTRVNSPTSFIRYTVGDLASDSAYTIFKAGQPLSPVSSDSSGRVGFSDVTGTSRGVDYAIAAAAEWTARLHPRRHKRR